MKIFSKIDGRSLLKIPNVYRIFSYIVAGKNGRSIYVSKYIKAKPGDRILDIGCGPADIVAYLPDGVEYLGFDMEQGYIKAAQKRFGNRGTFFCKKVDREAINDFSSFDIVLATGVIHHLSDKEAMDLFELAWKALKPGGRLVTLDGCYSKDQSFIRRFFLMKDRGKYVRTKEGYLNLASAIFTNIKFNIENHLLGIPYTLIILECKK